MKRYAYTKKDKKSKDMKNIQLRELGSIVYRENKVIRVAWHTSRIQTTHHSRSTESSSFIDGRKKRCVYISKIIVSAEL